MRYAALALVAACGSDGGGSPDGAIPADAAPDDATVDAAGPLRLSRVGLFADVGSETLAPGVRAFAPSYELWSDGASKRRWLSLPEGAQIDTADMDHWRLPVGGKLFKEFVLDGVKLETRMIERIGAGDDEEDYFMTAFLWDADGGDAIEAPEGGDDVLGTGHDVPRAVECDDCHLGEPGRALGLSAIQLSHDGDGLTLASLAADGRLSAPPAAEGYPVPGDAPTAAALGYLHANCGHCHSPGGPAWADVDMVLRLDVAERDPATAQIVTSNVGVPLQHWASPAYTTRIVAGDPETSAVAERMRRRGEGLDKMPPLGSEIVDDAAVAAVSAWISTLP